MYIHLGEDILVRDKDIIAIFDKDSMSSSLDMEQLLEQYNISEVDPTFKSIVFAKNNLYFSQLSSGTIKKRILTNIQEFE